jgi:hypothetical protein
MHKNTAVVDMVVDPGNGYIDKIGAIHNPEHLPIGTTDLKEKNSPNRASLNEWWLGRAIPASRDKLQVALCALDISSPTALIAKSYGLSLSDHYWVLPEGSGLTWNAINFFDNDFSKDIGNILFGHEAKARESINMISPDNTSDGWLKKKWSVKDGKRVLIKGGSGVFEQEPFNEVIATAIMKRLGIVHVTYELVLESTSEGSKIYCLCENFVTSQTELVPAWRIVGTMKRSNSDSEITHLLRCCEVLGMDLSGITPAIFKMLTLDYIIANEDRHYNNFGFLRNAETLEWLGLAPIYDSGTSLWYNTQSVGSHVESKPFRKSHDKQIKLVQELNWFDCTTLEGIDRECVEILSRSNTVEAERAKAIGRAVLRRAGFVEQMR